MRLVNQLHLPERKERVVILPYKAGAVGPYPEDVPKRNHVPFTPVQVRARQQASASEQYARARVRVGGHPLPRTNSHPSYCAPPFRPSVRSQIEAIRSGVNQGLTLVVGPPGTGKTDVAVQIISNLYHNFPQQVGGEQRQ